MSFKKRILSVALAGAMLFGVALTSVASTQDGSLFNATVNAASNNSWMSECKPYDYISATEYLPTGEDYFVVAGKKYFEGVKFYQWNAARNSRIIYNLKGEYDKFSFDVGHIDGTNNFDTTFNIYIDGYIQQSVDVSYSQISEHVEVNLNGAKNLMVVMAADIPLNCYDITYGMFNGEFKKNGTTAEAIPESQWSGVEAYNYNGTVDFYSKENRESFLMGGDEYTDACTFYLWNGARSAEAFYNLDGKYSDMSFLFGRVDTHTFADASLIITLDGEFYDEISCGCYDLPKPVYVPLEGVRSLQLSLETDAELNVYDITYGIGSVRFTKIPVEAKGISLNRDSIKLSVDDTYDLTSVFDPEDTTETALTWKSSDESIATVDQNGRVTAVANGTAIITAETTNGLTAECTVEVTGIIGDVNGDGIADIADALLVARADAGLAALTETQTKTADVNGDGGADIADALMIARADAGLATL